MSLFDQFFGKKPGAPGPGRSSGPGSADGLDDDDDFKVNPKPIAGPPDFLRVAEIQKAYWTFDQQEQARLESRGFDNLAWPERLRLYHLTCLERLKSQPARSIATAKATAMTRRLLSPQSPYRIRPGMVWQGEMTKETQNRSPDLAGEFSNPSLTHLGSIEFYRLDSNGRPASIAFASFDELSGILFASPNLLRAAKMLYEGGREEVVYAPLLYGLTWTLGRDYDRSGQMTRFVGHLSEGDLGLFSSAGIGVGQQELVVKTTDKGVTLLGIGSVAQVHFPLWMGDPRFDEKARGRGLDPDAIRKQSKPAGTV